MTFTLVPRDLDTITNLTSASIQKSGKSLTSNILPILNRIQELLSSHPISTLGGVRSILHKSPRSDIGRNSTSDRKAEFTLHVQRREELVIGESNGCGFFVDQPRSRRLTSCECLEFDWILRSAGGDVGGGIIVFDEEVCE
jgi:hypothetical protein